MSAYYNENDPKTAAWLRELIKARLIADGEVDARSINDVQPADLDGFKQCHFFAGIGGWSLALRLAGWPDERSVWTGSCPCQPFSAAGRQKGLADERHLWPAWFRLIAKRKPSVVFGEQVESAIKHGWLDAVFADLEGEGYACGAVVMGAHSVRAPHIRQRLWFVGDSDSQRSQGRRVLSERADERALGSSSVGNMADSDGPRRGAWRPGQASNGRDQTRIESSGLRDAGKWDAADWLSCIDGKARPVEPGTFPLAYGISGRMVKLRGLGNAIVPQVAQAFIEAYCEVGV